MIMTSLNVLKFLRSNSSLKRIIQLRKCSTKKQSFVLTALQGKVNTDEVFPYPKVLTDEQRDTVEMLVDPVRKFFEEVNDAAKNESLESVEEPTLNGLKEMGAFGMMVPEKYGGIGLNNSQYARLVQVVGQYDLGVGIVLGAHQSIGYKGILLYGTPEQKEKYLPLVASGEKLAAYCLTESSAGSDANGIKCKAVLSPDGKHYILNGSKLWISNGGTADIFTVFAKTLVKGEDGVEKEKITAFIVEREFGGITHSKPEKKMGIKCSNTAALFFEDCKVPVENVLGEVGNGFKVAMNILNNGRFGMAAALSGTMRVCIAKAVEHISERTTFNHKLKEYPKIQEKIAMMQVKQYITESMGFILAGNMDRGIAEYQVEAAASKVYSSEAAWFCCDEAIQILGGNGFMQECGLEKIMRDLRIFRIFEGTSEILRLLLILQCFRYFSKSPLHIGLSSLNSAVGLSYQSNAKILKSVVHPLLSDASKHLASSIVLSSDAVRRGLVTHKRNIINKSIHLTKYADCAIELYGMAAALSKATDSLNSDLPTAEHELHLAKLACSMGAENVRQALNFLKTSESDEDNMKIITEELCKNGGTIHLNPLGF